MFFRTRFFIFIFIVLILFNSIALSGKIKRDTLYSFVPFKTKNLAAINLKKLFQLYDYKDISTFSLFDKKNKKGIMNVLSEIMKKADIDPEKDLSYLLFTNSTILNSLDLESLMSDIVIVFKLSYKPDKLDKAINSSLKKFNIRFAKGKLKKKIIIYLGDKFFKYSVFLHDERTILIGKKENVIEYTNTFNKDRKNILSNKELNSALEILNKKKLFTYYIKFSPFFKELLDQKDESFKMDLSKVENIEGSLDTDKITWSGEIKIISKNKKGNKVTENGLRKLLGMSAMGGKKFVEFTQKTYINAGNNGIRIFFTFDVE